MSTKRPYTEKDRERARLYYLQNKTKWRRFADRTPEEREAIRARNRANYHKHREKRLAAVKDYAARNRELVLAKAKERYRKTKPRIIEYRKRNSDKINAHRLRYYYRHKANPSFRIARAMRQAVQRLVKRGATKSQGTVKYLGCSWSQARDHIERQFQPGMTWENYGTAWHIDHIIPIAAFDLTLENDIAMATRWDNLRPLWVADNLKKGDRWSSFQSELPIQLTA